MLLAIDAGNTNTVFAVFEKNRIAGKWRISTDSSRTADEYALFLIELIKLSKIDYSRISDVVISTVVPRSLFSLKTFAREYFRVEPIIIGEDSVKVGIKVKVERPKEVGADRLVNALAAYKIFKKACIIIDFGTATTFDVISEEGEYVGGVISPGINLSIDALKTAAAKLPEIAVARPENVIGKSTVAAMQSGIYWGYVGLIEGITQRIRDEYGIKMKVIATGGLSPLFAKGTEVIEEVQPDLTLHGLNFVYELNKK